MPSRGRLPPQMVRDAIRCGPTPRLRAIEDICKAPKTRQDQVDSALESLKRILINLSYQDATGAKIAWEIGATPVELPAWMQDVDHA